MKTFLRNKNFRYITISDWVSVLGDSLFYLALINYAASMKYSELAITAVTIGETIPNVLSFLAGHLCDRTKRKYVADIGCAFIRAFLYLGVGVIFLTASEKLILIAVIIINLVSDFLGNYSDCLRFPEIYAIVPDDEFESSNGFSSGIYYTFSVIGKFLGGIILLLFKNNYTKVAFVNAFSFVICGILMLSVMGDVNSKMRSCESEMEDNKTESLLNELKKIFVNCELRKNLLLYTMLNSMVSVCTFTMYINLIGISSGNDSKYAMYLSIIEGISIIGLVAGNILSSLWFENYSLSTILNIEFGVVIVAMLSMYTNIVVLSLFFLIMFFVQGILSIKFTSYIYSNQQYESLGLSTGIINTVLTIGVPILWFIVSMIGNLLSFDVATAIICIICFSIIIYRGIGGSKNVKA